MQKCRRRYGNSAGEVRNCMYLTKRTNKTDFLRQTYPWILYCSPSIKEHPRCFEVKTRGNGTVTLFYNRWYVQRVSPNNLLCDVVSDEDFRERYEII